MWWSQASVSTWLSSARQQCALLSMPKTCSGRYWMRSTAPMKNCEAINKDRTSKSWSGYQLLPTALISC